MLELLSCKLPIDICPWFESFSSGLSLNVKNVTTGKWPDHINWASGLVSGNGCVGLSPKCLRRQTKNKDPAALDLKWAIPSLYAAHKFEKYAGLSFAKSWACPAQRTAKPNINGDPRDCLAFRMTRWDHQAGSGRIIHALNSLILAT